MSNIKTFTIEAHIPRKILYYRDDSHTDKCLSYIEKEIGGFALNTDINIRSDVFNVFNNDDTIKLLIVGQEAVSHKYLEHLIWHLSQVGTVLVAKYIDFETKEGPFNISPVNHNHN